MVEIRTYSAQRSLSPAPTPVVAIDNTMAQAVQGLGSNISNAAAAFQERTNKKEQFTAENAYRRLNLELEQDLNNRAQTIAPGGDGFHDGFVADVYRPKRDAFLASLPDSLKPRFSEILADDTGADSAEWSTRAATVERDEGYRWAKQEVQLTQQQMVNAIALDPTSFEQYLEAGEQLIASTPLPTPEQEKMRFEWRQMAQVASLDAMLKEDPQSVLRVLGVDTRQLSPTTQFQMLSRAVQWQESTDNPNAISPKGAVGLMQVMPDTARDIAKALGDPNFPTGGSRDQVTQYMSNPFVNKRYGEEYLRQQLRTFGNTRNPIETALVAYNAGPSVAQKWVESGYNDAMLPKETRDYKTNILGTMSAPLAAGNPSAVRFVNSDGKPFTPTRPSGNMAADKPDGLVRPGNIDILNRPRVQNADGSVSTVRSMSFEEDGVEVLIPTVSDDGRIMSDDEAVAEYRRTGKMLGVFATPAQADAYAETLHTQQEKFYGEASGVPQVSRDLTDRVSTAFAALGIPDVKVNSGFRDPDHNHSVGGAKNSEHTRGNALDIDVSGMPHAKRLEVIKALSAAGVTGIGVYANTIHADIGGRRAWGPDYSSGSVPKWAQGVIAEHLAGTVPPVRAVANAYGDLAYDQRQKYTAQADQIISTQLATANKATAVQIVETRRAMENEIATVRTTGVSTGRVNETAISTILGEDDYLRYVEQKDTAQRTFTAVNDIPALNMEDITRRIEDYAPIPGAPDFARQQEIQVAVKREADRVINLRAKDPAAAALLIPEVKSAWDELSTIEAPEPSQVQGFVQLMLEKQADFDIAPEARAPIPTSWAVEIGRALSRTPEPAGRNIEDVRYSIQAQYNSLQQFFGDYTDEVIIHALTEYKGVSTTTAEVINGYMKAIQGGGDPFRIRGASQAEDMDQVDSLSLYRQTMIDNYNNALAPFFGGGQNADAPMSTGMSPEEMLRSTPEE